MANLRFRGYPCQCSTTHERTMEHYSTMDPSRSPYRLGLDVGSNSLGWFIVWLDGEGNPTRLGPGGVRIYPDGRDPQSKTSNAVDRRVARGARRRGDRRFERRGDLLHLPL